MERTAARATPSPPARRRSGETWPARSRSSTSAPRGATPSAAPTVGRTTVSGRRSLGATLAPREPERVLALVARLGTVLSKGEADVRGPLGAALGEALLVAGGERAAIFQGDGSLLAAS